MPKFNPKDTKIKSQILKNLRSKVDVEIGKIDKLNKMDPDGSVDSWLYLQMDEHVKVGGYIK